MSVSRETSERLQIYEQLLLRWNPRINLIAEGTISDLRSRHIEDSLQVAQLASQTDGNWVDLGTGGGLPGLVLAIAKADTDIKFTLVESDRRKASFLREVIRKTDLKKVVVIADRIEAIPPLSATWISARALAPLPKLMSYLDLHLAPEGKAFLMKGRQWRSEVEDARVNWTFNCIAHPSLTQEGAATLEISGVSHGAS